MEIPKTQQAIQLVGPEQLRINPGKEVFSPGPYQILAKVQAVGLCFSDLKLLKQFDRHPRKSEILSGIDPDILLRSQLSFLSDLAVFLLQNAAAGLT